MNSDDDNAVIVLSDSDVEKDDESSLFSNDESDVDEEVLLFCGSCKFNFFSFRQSSVL
jgi:hypothetical protein